MVKNPPAKMQLRSLGREDPREEEMVTLFSILALSPIDRGACRATIRGVTKSDKTEHAHHCRLYFSWLPSLFGE